MTAVLIPPSARVSLPDAKRRYEKKVNAVYTGKNQPIISGKPVYGFIQRFHVLVRNYFYGRGLETLCA
ncbi:hypothetical protein LDC_2184 [sediment metagenome]|uniref:Uncharacterized protein n=1 Tax=sediment metagenome TaxID=749907 RepID=D9PKW3_9ZZZZ